ncbi:MAG TPA: hypothetical protein ENF52_06615, partial [Chloroflexi bacterium]|nr:hypothetical protein [Chloroflexota bacterium]
MTRMTSVLHFWRLMVIVIVVTLLPSCSSPRRELIAYTTVGGCGWVTSLDGVQSRPTRADLCVYRAKWSPDGKYVLLTVATEFGMSIWVADASGGNPRQVSPEFDAVTGLWLNNHLVLIDAITGGTEPSTINSAKIVNYSLDLRDGTVRVYSRDLQLTVVPITNNRWVTLGNQTGLRLHDLSGDSTPILQGYAIGREAFDISPSGHTMVFFDHRRGDLYQVVLSSDGVSEPIPVYTLDEAVTARVAWSPNEEYVALLDIQGNLFVFDADDFSLVGEFNLGRLDSNGFIWSPHS